MLVYGELLVTFTSRADLLDQKTTPLPLHTSHIRTTHTHTRTKTRTTRGMGHGNCSSFIGIRNTNSYVREHAPTTTVDIYKNPFKGQKPKKNTKSQSVIQRFHLSGAKNGTSRFVNKMTLTVQSSGGNKSHSW